MLAKLSEDFVEAGLQGLGVAGLKGHPLVHDLSSEDLDAKKESIRMTMPLEVSASLVAILFQPRAGFRPSLTHSWLEPSGPINHLALGDKREQTPVVAHGRQTSREPLDTQLHGVFEAQLTQVDIGMAGGLRHEQANHVVGQQMDPQLFLVHLRRQAVQHLNAGGGLKVAQVESSLLCLQPA